MKFFNNPQKRIYLDYASSTPIDPSILKQYIELLGTTYANPHSLHKEGVKAFDILEESRVRVAKSINALPKEITFVSSATESDNLALFGAVRSARLDPKFKDEKYLHVLVSAIEHAGVLEVVKQLEKENIIVEYIPVTAQGVIDLDVFKKMLRPTTVLVSVMMANNEIGTMQPIAEIAKIIRHAEKHERTQRPYPYFHTDASQAFNYLTIDVQKLSADLITFSSSKIYGPKGVGFLFKKRTVTIEPVTFGGGQEHGLRSGTENVPAIAAASYAVHDAQSLVSKELDRISRLKKILIDGLKKVESSIVIHGYETDEQSIPGIISFSIPAVDSDMVLLYLDAQGFAVSSKSACHAEIDEVSHVLRALYGDKAIDLGGTVRVSLGRYTEESDIESFQQALKEILPKIQ
jgi:cysteine desulfurase